MPGLAIRSERLRRGGPRSGASPRRCCPSARLTRVSTALGLATRSPVGSLPIIIAAHMESGRSDEQYCKVSLPLQTGIFALASRLHSSDQIPQGTLTSPQRLAGKGPLRVTNAAAFLSPSGESSPQHTDQHVVDRDNTGLASARPIT
jgi:hypothetical protein